jgi:hypothetical protein
MYFTIEFVLGSTSSVDGTVTHTTPMARGTYGGASSNPTGISKFYDSSGGGTSYTGTNQITTANACASMALNASATYTTITAFAAAVPFTWAESDELFVAAKYELI